jgi:exopolyphosphatase / guanosine-5'-triphosphate,3'-diphosphate pyrophosphatase
VPTDASSAPLGTPAAPLGPAALAAAWQGPTFAALDLGTNNCRLLVARRAGRGFRVIDAFSRIVRLGEGLATTGVLSEAAMARSVEALKICAGKVALRRVTRGRYIATEACRRAANCAEFLARVQDETGIAIEIISSQEEARLVVAGCAPLLDRRIPRAIVFDIGGGSTELVWLALPSDPARPPEVVDYLSLPNGVVTLTDRYGGRDVSRATYNAMVTEMREALEPFEARHRIAPLIAEGAVQMLGSSGTVTTLAGIHLDLPRYNRAQVDGTALSFEGARAVSERLVGLGYAARAAHPCIGSDRADLVLAGCAVLEAICQLWPVGRLRVADRGIREGILLGLLGKRTGA